MHARAEERAAATAQIEKGKRRMEKKSRVRAAVRGRRKTTTKGRGQIKKVELIAAGVGSSRRGGVGFNGSRKKLKLRGGGYKAPEGAESGVQTRLRQVRGGKENDPSGQVG